MKKTIIMALMLTVAGSAMCQLKSVGAVPADLKMRADEIYQADLKRAEVYTGGKVKDKERARLREASYSVGKMMAGGKILYGDPVSRMLSRIADTNGNVLVYDRIYLKHIFSHLKNSLIQCSHQNTGR